MIKSLMCVLTSQDSSYPLCYFEYFFKELLCLASRFGGISCALRRWVFIVSVGVALPAFSFLSVGVAKVGIFLVPASFFLSFYFFPRLASLLIFNPLRALRLLVCCSLFGLAKVWTFFHSRKKYFLFFFLALFASFQYAVGIAPLVFCWPLFRLGLQRWGYLSFPTRARRK